MPIILNHVLKKNYFNNDINYLKSVKIKIDNKVIHGPPSLDFGWGWHLPCNFNITKARDIKINCC